MVQDITLILVHEKWYDDCEMMHQVGESNFVIKAGGDSPLFGDQEMHKSRNWCFRPAIGNTVVVEESNDISLRFESH